MYKAKWANKEHTAVILFSKGNAFVPKNHKFYKQWGIENLEYNGLIQEFQTDEEKSEKEVQELRKQCLDYLNGTDFLVIKEAETGELMSEDIKEKRELARLILEQSFQEPPSDLFNG